MAKLSCLLIVSFAVVAALAATDDDAAAAAEGITVAEASSDPENKCVYTIYVRTGTIWKGGTDSVIGVTLLGADGSGVRIRDLERWGGLMGDGHDYYERGNLDIFSGRGPCMRQAPCRMNLTSDGTGPHHGWYCNYLEATVTGPHLGCAQQLFTVEQWLATDASPYRLYAVVDNCNKAKDAAADDDDADEPRVTVL
ncbi:PLAT domain-containing protein 3-like [Oryza glaberrima]|nr:PLAT domain-containing protein 3-like [Oryza glaberrima]